ncbi:uncharacterized protein LOC110854248 [Folsomia candida]|uniref:uncharacterized protein LOC110854248 n=1 Tax=Folsomia candida TaxID=158441 RepID=UPI000B8F92E0|nr:uncharacterized protein LOC110854248 [Folsomia candida]
MSIRLNLQTLNSPDGILKLLHVLLGTISLILISFSYVPHNLALDIFLVTISVCLAISTLNLFLNCIFSPTLLRTRPKQIVGFIFHLLAGAGLILAGIDLIGWSEYDHDCGFKCPHIYYIGVAKILTFVNGTLYAIHGFLDARGEDEEDFLTESFPLLRTPTPTMSTSTTPPSIIIQPPSPTPTEPRPHYSGGMQSKIN